MFSWVIFLPQPYLGFAAPCPNSCPDLRGLGKSAGSALATWYLRLAQLGVSL